MPHGTQANQSYTASYLQLMISDNTDNKEADLFAYFLLIALY